MTTASSSSGLSRHSSGPLAERILDAFPSGSYALAALLRLLDIVETTKVPTAAVECRVQPRLLVNPDFVARHADTAEKLLVLVMHELHHVLLGHTTLFPRATKVQNFVFDAVINGIVCRMFPAPEHTAFFTDYYDAGAFPECLLRPPPGWPDKAAVARGISGLSEAHRELAGEVHQALYSTAGATYQEVCDLLPKLLDAGGVDGVPLIGGHDEDEGLSGRIEQVSPVLFEMIREIVEQWPQPPDPIRGRSLADVLSTTRVAAVRVPSNRAILRKLIRKIAHVGIDGVLRRLRIEEVEAATPVPGLARRSVVLRALGHEPLLHPGRVTWRRTARAGQRVHVYLDVSGSMGQVISVLYGAILDCQDFVHPTVHLFSTEVADVGLADLRRGVRESTGGTDIACVAEHMAVNCVRRALLVTDGWVGTPRGSHLSTLAGAKLAVAYLGDSNKRDLETVVDHSATLSVGG
jgi:hypothetical protein